MHQKLAVSAALAAIIAVGAAGRADADLGEAIVGGIIGGVIVNEATKNRQRKTTTKRTYRAPVNNAARAEARQVQTSLNYFGFPAGTADGVLGRKSRGAITQYQAHLGYPPTGYLTDYEKSFLLGSYQRAIAGGAYTAQQIAAKGMGPRGLLLVYRDEAAGVTVAQPVPVQPVPVQPGVAGGTVAVAAPVPVPVQPALPGTVAVAAPVPTPVINQPATTVPVIGNAAPTTAPAQGATATAALPNFLGSGDASVSLASHCNTVSLLTNTNGGFTTLASMSDPDAVLNEQFCLARTYAIAEGEKLAASIQGVGVNEIAAQCKSFGPILKEHVAALSMKSRDEVLQGVSSFVLNSGMAPAQLTATSKICLSVGYRTDDMEVAIGSGLVLTALGEQAYAELMGHHLNQGFGATMRKEAATEWYMMAVSAVEGGSAPVFAPGQPERTALIKAAVAGPDNAMNAPVQPASTSLPTFKFGE
ncbi:MAG: peptidoglycan-binding domain-containing protein [Pseudomonadota bacterium]